MSIGSDFTPRFLTASEYVLDLFEPAENVAVLVRNRETGKTIQRIARAETVASPEFQTWLVNQNAAGSDVFLGMNPLKDEATSRMKADIKDIRTIYLDLDRNADQSLQAIRNSTEVPPPNFVLDTSPKKHQVVWKVSRVSQEQAESLLRNLASEFDGDRAATDSTRVLRLPGFTNRKLSEEFVVRARHETDTVHTLRNFAIEGDCPEATRHIGDARQSRTIAAGHRSQSERDWAYAKRALERGDEPEEIIRRIADYRGQEKADPNYYARRTVTQAQFEQKREEPRSSEISESPSADEGPNH